MRWKIDTTNGVSHEIKVGEHTVSPRHVYLDMSVQLSVVEDYYVCDGDVYYNSATQVVYIIPAGAKPHSSIAGLTKICG